MALLKHNEHEVDDMLVEGEKILIEAEIHWAIYWRAGAVLLLGVMLSFYIRELGSILMLVSLGMFAHAALKKYLLMLVVTNKRVLARYGILQIDVVDMHFDRIESLELERMLPGYLLGYANVILMGTGNRYIVIPYVQNARDIRRQYNEEAIGEKTDKSSS